MYKTTSSKNRLFFHLNTFNKFLKANIINIFQLSRSGNLDSKFLNTIFFHISFFVACSFFSEYIYFWLNNVCVKTLKLRILCFYGIFCVPYSKREVGSWRESGGDVKWRKNIDEKMTAVVCNFIFVIFRFLE